MSVMMLTPPAVEPLSLAEAKAWLRVDDAQEDALIASLVVAARTAVEQASGRVMIRQIWRQHRDTWPTDGCLRLAVAPVLSVEALRVRSVAGTTETVPQTAYRLEAQRQPPILLLTGPVPLPGVLLSGIEIDLACGYGESPEDVPAPLRQAMRLLLARWFENRGDAAEQHAGLPPDVAQLVAPYRTPRL